MVESHSSREEQRKRMMMQRILNHGTLQRLAAARPLLVGVSVSEPPAVFCCCALRLSPPPTPPTGQRWLSTSSFSRASNQPKAQSPQEEPQSSSTPQSQEQKEETRPDASEVDPLQDKSIGLVQRFKKTFKQYGKVLIPVHLVTSTVWFGTFYYAAMKWDFIRIQIIFPLSK